MPSLLRLINFPSGNRCTRKSLGMRMITIGQSTNTLRTWSNLSGIALETVIQRIRRGVPEVQALLQPNQAGAQLTLKHPPIPWSVVATYFDGKVKLIIHQEDSSEHGLEGMYNAIFEEGGIGSFEDILPEFPPIDQIKIGQMREQLAFKVAGLKEMANPVTLEITIAAHDEVLLTEVFLRRNSQYVRPEPQPKIEGAQAKTQDKTEVNGPILIFNEIGLCDSNKTDMADQVLQPPITDQTIEVTVHRILGKRRAAAGGGSL